jgi:acyl dehydratase
MARYFSDEEISRAKSDKTFREKIRLDLEKKMNVGRMYPEFSDHMEFGGLQNVRLVTEEAVRRFCIGIGNANPLFQDKEYGKNSIYGDVIAPPMLLEALCTLSGGSRAGLLVDFFASAYNLGASAEYLKPVRLGDEIRAFWSWIGSEDKSREGSSLQFMNHGRKYYKNQRDETVAIVDIYNMLMARPESGGYSSKVSRDRKPYKFSEQEVADWYQAMLSEEIRGAAERFWEDVNVSDQLPPVHNVFSMTEKIAFNIGCGRGNPSWRSSMAALMSKGMGVMQMGGSNEGWKRLRDHESGLPDFANHHLTDAGAQRNGTPRANLEGAQMQCWLGTLITNWMGDSGFLKKLYPPVRQAILRESLILCKGQVVKKYIEGQEHLVDVRVTLEDHEGVFGIPDGMATVALPSRGDSSITIN